MVNYPQMGRGQSHVTIFFEILGPPPNLYNARYFKFGILQADHGKYFPTTYEQPKGGLSRSRDHILYFGTRSLNLIWWS